MAETKVLQLMLDERDAEAIAGALTIAVCIVTSSKAGAAMQLAAGAKPELAHVLVMKEDSRLGCAVAEFYGLPCPEHHGKKASRGQCAEAKVDALSRMSRLAELLTDFSQAYRSEKIEAFPEGDGDDWKPNFRN